MVIRIVRATVLTGFLAVVFMLLVVVGSAVGADVPSSCCRPFAHSVPTQVRLVGDSAVLAVQTDTVQIPTQNTGAVEQKTGPAAASTARTIDIVVVAALGALALFVWIRNGSARKGH
ncbi:MAG: hypothetical protein ABIQ18_50365 [Umezawaea sp.]